MSTYSLNDASNPEGNQQSIHLLDGEKDPSQVKARQERLARAAKVIFDAIRENGSNPTTKAEILSNKTVQRILHAFGDSFAHAKSDGTGYDPGMGHALDSVTSFYKTSDPDNPNEHRAAYEQYVKAISAAAGSSSGTRANEAAIESMAKAVVESPTESEQKDVLRAAVNGAPSRAEKVAGLSLTSASSTLNEYLRETEVSRRKDMVDSPIDDCGLFGLCALVAPVGSEIRNIYELHDSSR